MIRKLIGASVGLAFTGAAMFSFLTVAHAAEIGRAFVNGKEIILYDNNTWEYAPFDPSIEAADCTSVKSERIPASICLNPDKWRLLTATPPAEFMLQYPSEELYLIIVTEKIYVPMKLFKKAILQNAQVAAGLSKIRIMEDSTSSIDGRDFGHLIFASNTSGLDLVYENFHFTDQDIGSVQFAFFTASSVYPNVVPVIEDASTRIKFGN